MKLNIMVVLDACFFFVVCCGALRCWNFGKVDGEDELEDFKVLWWSVEGEEEALKTLSMRWMGGEW